MTGTLLHALQRNPAATREDLAAHLDATPAEIDAQLAELQAEGILLGYQAMLNTDRCEEREVTATIEVRIRPERGGGFDRIAHRIAKFEQVLSCYLMSGGYDLLVVVRGDNLREVSRFVAERLSTMEGVLSTSTHFRLKIYKENGMLLAGDDDPDRLAVSP